MATSATAPAAVAPPTRATVTVNAHAPLATAFVTPIGRATAHVRHVQVGGMEPSVKWPIWERRVVRRGTVVRYRMDISRCSMEQVCFGFC